MLEFTIEAYTKEEWKAVVDAEEGAAPLSDRVFKRIVDCNIEESLSPGRAGTYIKFLAVVLPGETLPAGEGESGDIVPASVGVGKTIEIKITATDDDLLEPITRRFSGVVASVQVSPSEEGFGADALECRFTLIPAISRLQSYSLFKTYKDVTPVSMVTQMIKDTIGDASIEAVNSVSSRSGSEDADRSVEIPYLIQSGDNCWSFLLSTLAERGLSLVTQPGDSGERVQLLGGDSPIEVISEVPFEIRVIGNQEDNQDDDQEEVESGLDAAIDRALRKIADGGDSDSVPDSIGELGLVRTVRAMPAGHGLGLSYDYKHGNVVPGEIVGDTSQGGSTFSVVQGVDSIKAKGVVAFRNGSGSLADKVRYESIISRSWHAFFTSLSPRFRVGQKLNFNRPLANPDDVAGGISSWTDTVFIESLSHRFIGKTTGNTGMYSNSMVVRDASVPWRPAMPAAQGKGRSLYPTVTGRVYGGSQTEDGAPVSIDEHGRVPVVCLWDTRRPSGNSGNGQSGSSSPVVINLRVTNLSAGATHGSHFGYRHGDEVLIQLLNGRPDEAVITARIGRKGGEIPVQQLASSGGFTAETLEQYEETEVDLSEQEQQTENQRIEAGRAKIEANAELSAEERTAALAALVASTTKTQQRLTSIVNQAFMLFKRPVSDIEPPPVTPPATTPPPPPPAEEGGSV